MAQVISFTDYTPAARYDAIPWTDARVDEAAAATGPWTVIDTIALDPVDVDPATPASRSFTTELASDTPGLWYRVVFVDGDGDVSQPTDPVQNVATPDASRLYITADELREQLTLTGATFSDGALARAMQAASGGIDGACRRRFWLDPEPVTRLYTPDPPSLLEIDDLTSAATITVTVDGDEWTEGDDYLLAPYNAPADDRPYEHIRFLTALPTLSSYDAAVAVTGRFGWPAVPANIHTATAVLAGKLAVRLRLAPSGIVSFGTAQGVAMRIAQTDPDIVWLLKTYARQRTQSLQLR